ncbi:hypothetical protein G5714_022146 [Onychostoma macrolepis]|uniref:Uncharacterized protein n=1 Tax=Onychostoma macrolepis TaxID=369639 RepID=A0A7J6BM85_9TELE|nr:hypothetical protein G5714_022146 [Onychostoma macrolepis]
MERLCSKFLRIWLGVPPSFSAINLHSKTSKLPLPVSSVVEEFKDAKARAVSTLLSFEDGKVRHAIGTLLQVKASQSSLPHSGEVFRLRGETLETLRSLLTMRKGSNNVDAPMNTISEEDLHHHI